MNVPDFRYMASVGGDARMQHFAIFVNGLVFRNRLPP